YTLSHHARSTWKLHDRVNFNPPAPRTREEAFPHLWDRAPHVLWDLISKSGTVPVQEFATPALRDEQLATVLATGHLIAQQFAFDIARMRPLSTELARGALSSDIAEAQQ